MKITRTEWRRVVTKVYRLTLSGRRIEAVRLLRNTTGCGLKEAVDATKLIKPMASHPSRPW